MIMVRLCHLKVLKKNSELRHIITYTGCAQAIKSYIRKTERKMEGKNSADLIKTLKTIYNQQKGSRLYYEVPTQNITKPNCCDKWEVY